MKRQEYIPQPKKYNQFQKLVKNALNLNYYEDIRSLFIIGFYFFLVIARWKGLLNDLIKDYPIIETLWLLTIALFSFYCSTIIHNTVHVPVFKSGLLNSLFFIVLTHTYGHPISNFIPGHNLSHHKYTQLAQDVMRTQKAKFKWHLLNLLTFCVFIIKDITKSDKAYFDQQKKLDRPIYKQLQLEKWSFYPIQIALCILDWQKYLWIVFLPQIFGKYGIITINLVQHDGCVPSSEEGGILLNSRNFTGGFLNWVTCNNGFHTIHHEKPGWHWSYYREAHEVMVAPYVPKGIDYDGILVYIFKTFFLPQWMGPNCGRRTYDGKPYEVKDSLVDEPWFYAIDETYSTVQEEQKRK